MALLVSSHGVVVEVVYGTIGSLTWGVLRYSPVTSIILRV